MGTTPLFDAYVMVDWSASARPVSGANSLWVCCLERVDGALVVRELANPATRSFARAQLADILSDLVARDRVTLAGFDFAFGYPAGFAGRLRPESPDWRGVWKDLKIRFGDDEAAAKNRFAIAAALNERLSGRGFPFWACPPTFQSEFLLHTRPEGYGATCGLNEKRLAETHLPTTQPVWKLFTPGSVGSQTLLGIPHLFALRHHPWLEERTRVWPFEVGLAPLAPPGPAGWRVLLAEVYPSMVRVTVPPGAVKDAVQVKALAEHFATLDQAGRLAPLFSGPRSLVAAERAVVEREEGWILGAEARPVPSLTDYQRDPAAIYAASFAAIRAETNLSSLPEDLWPVAIRLVHACGMPDLVADLAFAADVAPAARAALARGAPILVDAEMVAHGIIRGRLRDNAVVCTLNDPSVPDLARRLGTTRSAAAVDLWRDRLEGAVVAIGNAPTALFRLLELLAGGAPRPAAILGFPVGFIGAAESKESLIHHADGIPYLTLKGRRGGSALAAAAVNALAGPADEGLQP
ncbi:MAG: precorrin-8X methylmutase [Alphaproteobacteria bacterium]